METFLENEEKNGTRWSWNVLPASKIDLSKMVLPLGCLYTPLKEIEEMPVLEYDPVVCSSCNSVLNPYCRVDFKSKTYDCPICLNRNSLPNSYSGISEKHLPAELYPQFTTIEYVLNKKETPPPTFLFVIDTCVDTNELDALRDSILQSIELIPENARIGLIVFGTTVQVFELGYTDCSKAYVFRGDKDTTFESFEEQLGLKQQVKTTKEKNLGIHDRFLLPISEAEATLTYILEELQADPWPIKPKNRPKRATGAAISIATSLLEAGGVGSGSRILLFLGGACTFGPGQVVGTELNETIRLHNDLKNGNAKYYKKAVEHYQKIAKRLIKNGHALDVFMAYIDQCGGTELRSCCENTGGEMQLSDTFENPTFKETYKRFWKKKDDNLTMSFNATIDIKTSSDMKIMGAIGCLTSLNKKTEYISEDEIGYGKTSAWKINVLNNHTTVGFYFTLSGNNKINESVQNRYFQFVTQYQHSNGQHRLRITTQGLPWVPNNSWEKISAGFDQQAAAVLIARVAIFRSETDHLYDVLKSLDKNLIQFMKKFATYQKNDPNTFELSTQFSMFPQFMYHLRRSQFLRVFNSSPDETTYYRIIFNKENCKNSITMIQPTLVSFALNEKPKPVLLDSLSIQDNNILLLDTFFHVLIHYGEQIMEWKEEGYHELEKYKHFKNLLELPKQAAQVLMKERYPFPKFVECVQDDSASRILIAKINPSTTHHSLKQSGYTSNNSSNYVVISDDASLQDFMKHLKKLSVQN